MSFNYKIFNDMSAKLKAAEANVDEVRKRYQAKISAIVEEYETKLRHNFLQFQPASEQNQQIEPTECDCKKEGDEVDYLKKKVSQLTYDNNRYHLMLSNCTMCSDDHSFEDSTSLFDSSTQSSLIPTPLLSSAKAVESVTTPTPCTADEERWSTRVKKDKAYIA